MPVTSAPQFRLMEAAKGGNLRGMAGPSPSVAQHFLSATPKATLSNFAKTPRVKKFSSALRRAKRLNAEQ